MKKAIITAFIVIGAAVLVVLAVTDPTNKLPRLFTDTPSNDQPPTNWKEIASPEWEFSARLPTPVEHKKTSLETPFGDAPLETYAGWVGPVRFTVGVSQYDPHVGIEFTEEQRYESAAKETPKLLGGELTHNEPIQQHGVSGREQIIKVAGEATIHTRMFLVGNRSYQIQVTYPPSESLDPATMRYFLESLTIKYQPSATRTRRSNEGG